MLIYGSFFFWTSMKRCVWRDHSVCVRLCYYLFLSIYLSIYHSFYYYYNTKWGFETRWFLVSCFEKNHSCFDNVCVVYMGLVGQFPCCCTLLTNSHTIISLLLFQFLFLFFYFLLLVFLSLFLHWSVVSDGLNSVNIVRTRTLRATFHWRRHWTLDHPFFHQILKWFCLGLTFYLYHFYSSLSTSLSFPLMLLWVFQVNTLFWSLTNIVLKYLITLHPGLAWLDIYIVTLFEYFLRYTYIEPYIHLSMYICVVGGLL